MDCLPAFNKDRANFNIIGQNECIQKNNPLDSAAKTFSSDNFEKSSLRQNGEGDAWHDIGGPTSRQSMLTTRG